MKLKKTHIIDNLTRDDVKYYETRLGTPGQKRHKTKKVDQSDFVIPQISQYDEVINNNYNVAQLKLITKRYGLKVSGNKNELNKRVYLYLSKTLTTLRRLLYSLPPTTQSSRCRTMPW